MQLDRSRAPACFNVERFHIISYSRHSSHLRCFQRVLMWSKRSMVVTHYSEYRPICNLHDCGYWRTLRRHMIFFIIDIPLLTFRYLQDSFLKCKIHAHTTTTWQDRFKFRVGGPSFSTIPCHHHHHPPWSFFWSSLLWPFLRQLPLHLHLLLPKDHHPWKLALARRRFSKSPTLRNLVKFGILWVWPILVRMRHWHGSVMVKLRMDALPWPPLLAGGWSDRVYDSLVNWATDWTFRPFPARVWKRGMPCQDGARRNCSCLLDWLNFMMNCSLVREERITWREVFQER